jgi:multidrug resistance efflux pump
MEVTISAEVIGVVESYNADIGDRVKSGQTLVIIDQTDYRLALKEAEANLEVGQARLDAMKKSFVPASEIKRLRYSRLRNRLIIQAGRRRIKIRNVIEVRKTPTKVPLLKWLATPAPGRSDKRKAVEALKNAIEGIATK